MEAIKIREDLYWIGIVDKDLEVFDVVMETEYGTSYNSYLLKTDEGVILFDTVKEKFVDEYIETLKSIVDLDDIRYIVVHHTEPDHTGSLTRLISKLNVKIVASRVAINFIREIVNSDFESIVAEGELRLLGKDFKFISAKFLHWPDAVYSYLPEYRFLFSCDSFGSHYAFSKLYASEQERKDDFLDAFKKYYDDIFTPFRPFVLKTIDELTMPIDLVLTGHGPIIDSDIEKYIDLYRKWSTHIDRAEVTLVYTSAYGYTEKLALYARKILEDSNITVKEYKIDVLNYESLKNRIIDDLQNSKGILIGSTTINADAVPIVRDLLNYLNPITHKQKVAFVFGSYGWSGEGVKNIQSRFKELRFKTLEPFMVKFNPNSDDYNQFKEAINEYKVMLTSS